MILNFILLVQYSTYFYIGTKDSYNMNDIRNFLLDFDKYFIREMQSEYNYFIDHTTHIESYTSSEKEIFDNTNTSDQSEITDRIGSLIGKERIWF